MAKYNPALGQAKLKTIHAVRFCRLTLPPNRASFRKPFAKTKMANAPELIEKIETHLREHLTPYRCTHVLSVRDQAMSLAKRHGINEDQAELAALLHDCLKELSNDDLLAFAARHRLEIDPHEQKNLSLLHGKVAPFYAKEEFGVNDEIVFDAMRKHTTGAVEMSPVAMVLFVADFCEPLRPYAEALTVRTLAERDLEIAALEVVQCKIRKSLVKHRTIHPDSFHAYNFMVEKRTGGSPS